MHPDTLAALQAAIRAEVKADPAARGYAGKKAAEIVVMLNAPSVTTPPAERRNVDISDVEGYLHGRLAMVPLIDWSETVEAKNSPAYTIARTLVEILTKGRLRQFLTVDDAKRANVLGMFDVLVACAVPGMTQAVRDGLDAMTFAPPGPATYGPSRWMLLIDGMSGAPTPAPILNDDGTETHHPGYPGPPNEADTALVQEALNG